MTYNKEEFVQRWWDLVVASKEPLLVADGDVYNIAPDAVRGLRFKDNGISFMATFEGIPRDVSIYKDDIHEIIENEDSPNE